VTGALDLRFLGPPEITFDGQPLKFATRKALALFAYLMVESGAHPREKLMGLFWPESKTHLAHSALRNTLARIKEALRGVDEPLRMDGDRVRVDISIASSLDLERVAWATGRSAPEISSLQNAAEASRGPFLDGLSLPDAPAFDEWLTTQRAQWGQRQSLVHDRLSLHQLEHHLIEPAIETVIRWIALDCLNETAYQRLMRLHFLNGDRSAALQAYETCREILSRELGVRPSAETKAALAYIRSREAAAQVAEPGAESREAFHIPFVGRADEFQGLVGAFHLVKKGRPQVAVVSGESGIGKTRLADEFLKWAGTEGADVLRGRAFETSAQLLPYQPIIDSLRERLEREHAPEDLLDDAWLTELTRILPELRERYPDLPPASGDQTAARARLFEAIARLAEALSARHPLIWLMDDLQWADTETLELLRYLAHGWRKGHAPILLLILMRSEALGHGAALREWMSGLTRDVNVTRFALTPVLTSDIQELIQSLAGDNTSGISELSAWFTAETAGQPFFLTETLTALDEYGALVWEDGKLNSLATLGNLKALDVESLTTVIRDVVLSRLEWLSQSASSMLSAAAVIGRNCSFELLDQVSGTNEQDSLNALDELLSARMIVEIRNEARPYTISHDRVREVVYAQLSLARKQIFHRRAAFALTERKAPPAELANHHSEAGDKDKAVEYLLKAGDDARGLYAYQEAIAAYQRAFAFLNEMGDHGQTCVLEWKASAQFALGKLYRFRGEFATALEWLAGAKEARTKLEDTAGLAQVLIETGITLHHKGEYAQVREVLNAGLALAREAGDTRSAALALLVLGKGAAEIQVDYVAARALYEESLGLYREMGDKVGISDLLNELGL
jgi:DNA-binding SARP family transcriptional activator